MIAVESRAENRALELLKGIWRNYSVLVVFVGIIGICAIAAPRFLRMDNLLNILRNTSTVGAIALGMTFVIIAGASTCPADRCSPLRARSSSSCNGW